MCSLLNKLSYSVLMFVQNFSLFCTRETVSVKTVKFTNRGPIYTTFFKVSVYITGTFFVHFEQNI